MDWLRRAKAKLRRSVEINGGAREAEKKVFTWKIHNFRKIVLGNTDTNLIEKQKFTFGAGSNEGKLCEWEVSLTGPTQSYKRRRWVGINFRLKNNLSDCEEAVANLKMTIFGSTNEIFWKAETGAIDMTRERNRRFPRVICLDEGDYEYPFIQKDGSLEIHLKFTLYTGSLSGDVEDYEVPSELKFLQTLSNDFLAFLTGEEGRKYCDIKLVCKDKREIKAHKIILAARSPVFRAMFQSGMKEDLGETVTIKDASSETMKLIMHYIYSGKLPPDWSELSLELKEELIRAADKYDLSDLVDFLMEIVEEIEEESRFKTDQSSARYSSRLSD